MSLWQRLFAPKAEATVPPMDGALRPNAALDQTQVVARLPAPDNLTAHAGQLVFSSENKVLQISDGRSVQEIGTFDAAVTALASGPQGQLAVALDSGALHLLSKDDTAPMTAPPATALHYARDGALLMAQGSQDHSPSDWVRDLMGRGSSGALWSLAEDGSPPISLTDGLAYAAGLCDTDQGILISEPWAHRLTLLRADGTRAPVLSDLPAYPGRISPATDGYWLCLFAPRNQLVEFVLKEDRFRRQMTETIAPEHWIAPALSSGQDFREPLQLGAIRTMGQIKPWAPTRSYGLVVHLDRTFAPTTSLHSRADGQWHGITSAVEWNGQLWLTSRGTGAVLRLPLHGITGARP